MEFLVLGPLEVRRNGSPAALGGPKQRTVMAMLIHGAGKPVSIDAVLEAVYGDEQPPGARRSVQTYVSNLRHEVGDAITRTATGYRLDLGHGNIDSLDFERAYLEAITTAAHPDDVSERLRAALAIWRGAPYDGVDAFGALEAEVARLFELRLAVLAARIDADLAAGRHRELIPELEALVVEHPFAESLRAQHMLALYRSGRQAEALRAYARTREFLIEELGVSPSADLDRLEHQILEHAPELDLEVRPRIEPRFVVAVDVPPQHAVDPVGFDATLAARDTLLDEGATEHDGAVIDTRATTGYAVFPTAAGAIATAAGAPALGLRAVVDHGEVEVGRDQISGPPLIRASRLVVMAHPGQILMSASAQDELRRTGDTGWVVKSLGSHTVPGVETDVQIFQVVAGGEVEEFPPLRLDSLPVPPPDTRHRSIPGYELRAEIAADELGRMYAGYQPSVGRPVVIRSFHSGLVDEPRFIRRFEAIAHRSTRLSNPNLVRLLDYWREPDRAFLVYEAHNGLDLEVYTREHQPTVESSMGVIADVGRALGAAHRAGLCHGRLSTEFIVAAEPGHTRVTEICSAAICDGLVRWDPSPSLAPEVIAGGRATPAADVFSLGVVAADLIGRCEESLSESQRSALRDVVARATDHDPRSRYPTVDAFVVDLGIAVGVPIAATVDTARNPYKGLAPFDEADAEDFFGRDVLVERMVSGLSARRLLVVLGPSGIGKSSAVRAGLLPQLRAGAVAGSEDWLFTTMTPGIDPFAALMSALQRIATDVPDLVADELGGLPADSIAGALPDDSTACVIVDQLEEVFAEEVHEETRAGFIQLLSEVNAARPARLVVVATMRSDFLGRILEYPGTAAWLEPSTLIVSAPTRSEILDMIHRPAMQAGIAIEPAAAQQMAGDVVARPGSLPLLQHTLTELVGESVEHSLTLRNYQQQGGLVGSVARRADALLGELSPQARAAARDVFLRMVTVSTEGPATRRRVRRSELYRLGIDRSIVDEVVDLFGRHRLLTFDRDPVTRAPTVEVTHEALIARWTTFRDWVEDAREALVFRGRLTATATEWIEADRDPGLLLRGTQLDRAEEWAAAGALLAGEDETALIAESREAAEQERMARRKRRRRMLYGMAAALVVVSVLALVAFAQRNAARHEEALSRAVEMAGQARLAIDENPDLAILLALEAERITSDLGVDPPPAVAGALRAATGASRLVKVFPGITGTVSPRGDIVVTDGGDPGAYELVIYARPDNWTEVRRVTLDAWPIGLTFDLLGEYVVVTYFGDAGPLETAGVVLSAETWSGVRSLPTADPSLRIRFYEEPRMSGDGRYLIAEMRDVEGNAAGSALWDLDSDEPPRLIDGRAAWLGSSSRVGIVRGGEELEILDVATDEFHVFPTEGFTPERLTSDPAGTVWIAAADQRSRQVRIYDLNDGTQLRTLSVSSPGALASHPDGDRIATGGSTTSVSINDVVGNGVAEFPGHPSGAFQIDFTSDGEFMVTSGFDATRLWAVGPAGHPELGTLVVDKTGLVHIALSPDGHHMAMTVVEGDAGLRVVDLKTRETVRQIDGLWAASFVNPVMSADGSVFAANESSPPHRGHLFDSDGRTLLELDPCQAVVALDAPGRRAVLDGGMGEMCAPRVGGPSDGTSAVISIDGATLLDLGHHGVFFARFGPEDTSARDIVAVIHDGSYVDLWYLPERRLLASIGPSASFFLTVTFSIDGRYASIGSQEGRVVVVDTEALLEGEALDDAIAADFETRSGPAKVALVSGDHLITTGSGDIFQVWDLGTLKPLEEFPVFARNASFLMPTADGRAVYYTDLPGTVRRHILDFDEFVELARSRVQTGWDIDRCRRFPEVSACTEILAEAG